MRHSISSRLLAACAAVIVITMLITGLLMSYLMRHYAIDNKQQELLAKGAETAAILGPALRSQPYGRRTLRLVSTLTGASQAWIIDPHGQVLAGTPPAAWLAAMPPDSPAYAALWRGESQSWLRVTRHYTDPSIVVAIPISEDSTVSGALFLYAPVTGIEAGLAQLRRLLLYSSLAGMIVAVILMLLVSRAITRPIAAIARAATAFAQGDMTARVKVATADEVGRLGDIFNRMADALAQVEQHRREFLANVTHDLKTPITAIRGYTEAILDGYADRPEQIRTYLHHVLTETERINRLVNDVLDLSRLQSGQLPLHIKPYPLAELIQTVVAKNAVMVRDKQITVEVQAAGTRAVLADPDRLEQVLVNLLANAVRYSPPGSTVTVTAREHSDQAVVTVADNGPGIPPQDLPHIWERFYRVEKSRAQEHGGTGLGLAIVKNLVEAMHGEVNVHSVLGKGSVFSFTIPLAKRRPDGTS